MWPLLKDLSDQVIWHGEKLEPAEWKDLITVLVSQMQNPEREQKSAPGINGGRVYFGVRTSQSSKRYMVEVIEAIYWFGTEHNVKFSEVQQSDCMGPGMEGFACTVCSLRSWIAASSACRRAASARSKLSLPTYRP